MAFGSKKNQEAVVQPDWEVIHAIKVFVDTVKICWKFFTQIVCFTVITLPNLSH